MHDCLLLVDNTLRPAADGAATPLLSPHDQRPVAQVARATPADVDAAVSSASAAFPGWAARPAADRERIIRQAVAAVRPKADEIGLLMALEQGKPLAQCRSEVLGACDTIEYYASEAQRIEGWTNPTEAPEYRSWVSYAPVGVCALITPWNYPVSLLSWKLGPALATGCTMVVKPTSVTPLSPTAFCAALAAGGLPPGVISVLNGSGSAIGEALARDTRVAKLALTGSTETGRRLLALAAPQLKKVSLELGGQCPAVVAADADLDLAAKVIAYKGFRNMGQSCSSINRVYAHASVIDGLVDRLRSIASKLTIGDGISNPKVDLGPMATRGGRDTVELHVADALAKGATLVTGGRRPEGDAFANGWYYLPTILTGCTHDMLVMREETFGPVVPFASFTSIDDAVTAANDTPFGLVAYLFTRDLSTAHRVSDRLEAGTVCVNHGNVNTNYGPYAGWKQSGYGLELSRRATLEYLKPKHLKFAV